MEILNGIDQEGGGDCTDIDGATIDDSVIGGTTPAAGSFTALKASTNPIDADGVGDRGFNDGRYALESNNLSDLNNTATAFGNIKQASSETATGVIEKATTVEVVTGTDTNRAVTPAGITARLEAPGAIGTTTPAAGIFTTLEASTDPIDVNGIGDRGFNDARYCLESNNLSDVVSAATSFDNIKQIATESTTGVLEKATTVEVVTGTDTDRATTPAGITARMATPGEIGGTTPAAGNFSTLRASTNPIDADGVGDRGFNDDRYCLESSNLSDINNAATSFDNIKQVATDSASGVSELSTNAETVTGTVTDRVTTPANITAKMAAPGAIGGTTPASGVFTSLEATGQLYGALINNQMVQKATFDILGLMTDPRFLNLQCEDPGAGTMIDVSGRGHDGTYQGSMTTGDRIKRGMGWALDPDGTDDYVNLGDHDDFSFGNGSSDEAVTWFGVFKVVSSSGFDIITKWDVTIGSQLREYIIYINSSEQIVCKLYDESANVACTRTTDLGLSESFHSFAITYDGSGGAVAADGINIYVNGVVVASTASNNASYVAMENLSTLLLIGADTGSGGSKVAFMEGDTALSGVDGSEWSAYDVHRFHQLCKGLYGI